MKAQTAYYIIGGAVGVALVATLAKKKGPLPLASSPAVEPAAQLPAARPQPLTWAELTKGHTSPVPAPKEEPKPEPKPAPKKSPAPAPKKSPAPEREARREGPKQPALSSDEVIYQSLQRRASAEHSASPPRKRPSWIQWMK